MQLDFERIYRDNLWNSSESRSGSGSELQNTRQLVQELKLLFDKLNIHSLLDIPCGDFNWMRTMDLSAIDYIGADIVLDLLAYLRATYHQYCFVQLDIRCDKLPRCDFVLCRDCIVHFDFIDGLRAVDNVRNSGARWFAATTFPSLSRNDDLTSIWRPLNLQLPPFNLVPTMLIDENYDTNIFGRKMLGIYQLY